VAQLDILIVNYNSTQYLRKCLQTAYDGMNGLSANVFVIDNASTDNVDIVKEAFPDVNLLKLSKNIGYAGAVNQCLPRCTAPFVVVMNPDISVSSGCFQSVLQYMDENEDVAIVGPEVIDCNGSVQGSARAFPTPLTALFGRSSFLTKVLPDNRISRHNILTGSAGENQPLDVDWVSGAFMAVRKSAINKVGPMDDRFFLYWEDADWCKRMSLAGWRVVYYPGASVVHYSGCSSKKNFLKSVVEFHKSAFRLFCKYRQGGRVAHSLLDPLVFWGLSLRLYMVLIIEGCSRMHQKSKSF